MTDLNLDLDPTLDLVLERVVPVSVSKVWRAWTEPALIEQWFTPAPWTTSDCSVDLRPGGAFRCTMRSPEGEAHPNVGCYLEVVPERRLVWTDALLPGFRPSGKAFMTGILLLAPEGSGTRYTAIARHADAATTVQHAEMGFHGGWGTALDQLVALMSGR
jgi:uncharacterized protein YndB with AHSA1/START domain